MPATPSPRSSSSLWGIGAVSVLAYALCDMLHELLGHGLATLLPVGVQATSISTIGLTTTASSPVVAAAGPLVNLALSLFLLLAVCPGLPPAWRYFGWLFGTINAFNATAYLVYSAILGSGDVAVVFDALLPPLWWRPLSGIAGIALYAAAIRVSLLAMRSLIRCGVISAVNAGRLCTLPYLVGGMLLTAGAALNPVSPWFILTSGAATGFGAMVGLLLIPPLLRRGGIPAPESRQSLRIGRGWIAAGMVAAVVFIGVFGPGVTLA